MKKNRANRLAKTILCVVLSITLAAPSFTGLMNTAYAEDQPIDNGVQSEQQNDQTGDQATGDLQGDTSKEDAGADNPASGDASNADATSGDSSADDSQKQDVQPNVEKKQISTVAKSLTLSTSDNQETNISATKDGTMIDVTGASVKDVATFDLALQLKFLQSGSDRTLKKGDTFQFTVPSGVLKAKDKTSGQVLTDDGSTVATFVLSSGVVTGTFTDKVEGDVSHATMHITGDFDKSGLSSADVTNVTLNVPNEARILLTFPAYAAPKKAARAGDEEETVETVDMRGQIHWNDTAHDWNELTRPTVAPKDPNELITLWRYTGEHMENAEQVTLQSTDSAKANYCAITVTEGIPYWTYTISGVEGGDDVHFFTKGAKIPSYQESDPATEIAPTGGELSQELKLNYIEYNLNYQPLEVENLVIPASNTTTVSYTLRLGTSNTAPELTSTLYQGEYTIKHKDGADTNGSTSNGAVNGIKSGDTVVFTQIPEGLSYRVIENQNTSFVTYYDDDQGGIIGEDGSKTTITNVYDNVTASMNKVWNDNADSARSEDAFKAALKTEYSLDDGETWQTLDADACDTLGITGALDYTIKKVTLNNWTATVTHGGATGFPAALEDEETGKFSEIVYRVSEGDLENYISSENEDGSITNTKSREFNAKICWKDIDAKETKRPDEVQLQMKAYYMDKEGNQVFLTEEQLASYGIENNGLLTYEVSNDSDTTDVHFEDLPMYALTGETLVYYVNEIVPDDYKATYNNVENEHGTNIKNCYSNGTITNMINETTTFTATKVWEDTTNNVARPTAKVYLYRHLKGEDPDKGEPVAIKKADGSTLIVSKRLSADFATTTETIDFSDLLEANSVSLSKYDTQGREYIYYAKEILTNLPDGSNPKYYKFYTDEEGATKSELYDGGTLTNTNVPMVDVSVSKTWKSAAAPQNIRGTKVTMKVKSRTEDGEWQYVKDGENDLEVTLQGFEESNPTVSKTVTLPACDKAGNFYEYELEEVGLNQEGSDTNLMNGGEATLNGEHYVFASDSLDMAEDREQSDDINTNDTAELGSTNTLSDTVDCKMVKVWDGVPNPDETYSANISLLRYDTEGTLDRTFDNSEYKCKLDSENNFETTFEGLPMYDEEGYRYMYSGTETSFTAPEDSGKWSCYFTNTYDKTNNLVKVTAVNYHPGDKTIHIHKTWKDDGDVECRTPVTVQVYDSEGNPWQGKTTTISESGNWNGYIGFTKDELDKLNEGITVRETKVGGFSVSYDGSDEDYPELASEDGSLGIVRSGAAGTNEGHIYKVENVKNNNDSFEITNTRVGEKNITVTKDWIDGSRDNDERPNITLSLYKDGELVDDNIEMTKDDVNEEDTNQWIHTIADLPKYDDHGKAFEYSVEENNIDALKEDEYKSNIEEGDFDGDGEVQHSGGTQNYIVTNKRVGITDYTVHKIWKDPKSTERRPGIYVKLYYKLAESEEMYEYGKGPLAEQMTDPIDYVWETTENDEECDMTCYVPELPKYSDENGEEIEYFTREFMPDRQDYKTYGWTDDSRGTAVADNADGNLYLADGQCFENRKQAKFKLKGVKTWSNLQAGVNPEKLDTDTITVNLYRYSGEDQPEDFRTNSEKYKVDDLVLGEASTDNRNFAFGELPKYDDDGELYTYVMTETIDGSMGYVYSVDPSGCTLNNTFVTTEKNNREIRVHKDWNSDEYTEAVAAGQDDFRYPDVTYMLYRSEGVSDTQNTIDFNKDPVDTITLQTKKGDSSGEAVFNNALIWSEFGIQYKYAVVEKIGNNVMPAYTIETDKTKVNVNDTEQYSPTNMPEEKTVSFENTYEATPNFSLSGNKLWKDQNNPALRPDDLHLTVYRKANGTSDSYAIAEKKLTEGVDYQVDWEKNGDTWVYTITGNAITEYSPNGQPWVYRVAEEFEKNPDIQKYYSRGGNGDATQGALETGVTGKVRKMTNIINSLNGTYTVSKEWNDNNNEYALRPTRVIVGLQRSIDGTNWEYVTDSNNNAATQMYSYTPPGEEDAVNVLACELSYSKNKWKYTFDMLAKADADGNPYQYRGVELAVGDATSLSQTRVVTPEGGTEETMAGSYAASYTVTDTSTTVTNTLDPTKLRISKTWDDCDDAYDTRSKSATGTPQITVKLQRALQSEYNANPTSESVWHDVTNTSGKVVTRTYQTTKNTGTWEMNNLPKCNMSGDLYMYRAVEITEGTTESYTTTYDNSVMNFTDITNTLTERDEATLTVTKTWRDGTATTHPEVVLELTRWVDGKKVAYPTAMTITLDGTVDDGDGVAKESAAWTATWEHLPKQDNQGKTYTYKVEEILVDGKTVTNKKTSDYLVSDGITEVTDTTMDFMNTESMSYKVTKEFKDDANAHRPSQITVQLQRKIDGGNWEDVESRDIKGFTNDATKQVASADTTFTDLPKYDKDNHAYTYRAIETKIGDQTVDENKFAAGYDVTETQDANNSQTDIVNTRRTVSFTGTKTWDDQSDFFGLRPTSVTVKAFTGTALVNSQLDKQPNATWTKSGNTWTFTFSDMPQYDNAGNKINYLVKETSTPVGYDKVNNQLDNVSGFADADDGDTVTVTNGTDTTGITNKLQTVDVTGTKTWNETVNGTGYNNRPEDTSSIVINLLNQKKTGTDKKVAVPEDSFAWTKDTGDDNTWSYTFSDVPKKDAAGNVISYTTSEESPADYGYSVAYDSTNLNPTNTIEKTTVTAKKVWVDQKNHYQTRPSGWNKTDGTGLFEVYADIGDGNGPQKMAAQPTCSWTSSDNATYTFEAKNLQKFRIDADGNKVEIAYSVKEKTMPANYEASTSSDGKTITNTLKVKDFSGTKTWDETVNGSGVNIRPTDITLTLYGDGNEVTPATGALSWDKTAANTWKYTYSDLPAVDATGNEIVYSVAESGAGDAGYLESYDNTNTNVTNTIEKTSVEATKVWVDQTNHYDTRPLETVWKQTNGAGMFKVFADGVQMATQPTCTWTKVDDNTYTFKAVNLQKYKVVDGKKVEIAYTVQEPNVPVGYTRSVSDDGKTITNTLQTKNVVSKKIWNDTVNGSAPSNRPASVSMALKNGTATVDVPAAKVAWTGKDTDTWTCTFSDVPKIDKATGKEIAYTVEESGAKAKGYTESYDTAKLNVTNTIDKTTLTATKVWDDQKDKYHTRPSDWNKTDGKGLFEVYADYGNGPVKMTTQPTCTWTSTDQKNYTFKVENLQKQYVDADGVAHDIAYSVKEKTLTKDYTSTTSTDGKTITNTLETVGLTGTKEWDDQSDKYGTRPAVGDFELTVERSTDGKTWTTTPYNPVVSWADGADSDHDTWTYSYEGLPKKDQDGNEYTYRVKETVPDGYSTEEETAEDTETLTNSLITLDLEGTKVWDDQSNKYSTRPAAKDFVLTVQRKIDGGNWADAPGKPAITWTNADNDHDTWSYKFKDLPKTDTEGNDFTYRVKETVPKGYEANNNKTTAENNETLTNNLKTTNLAGSKIWEDQGDKYGTRPAVGDFVLTVERTTDGNTWNTITGTPTVNWTNADSDHKTWSYAINNLPATDTAGNTYTYRVKETVPTGYETTQATATNNNSMTNSLKTVDLEGSKVWSDQSNKYSTRPAVKDFVLTVQRKVDGGEWADAPGNPQVVWTNADNDHNTWTYKYSNLPKTDTAGNAYTYRVKETVPQGYKTEKATAENKETLTNNLQTTSLAGKKVWVDHSDAYGTRPTAANFVLTVERTTDGTTWNKITGTPAISWTNADSDHNTWSYSYSNLPKTDTAGNEYTYRVKETVPTGYHTTATEAANNGTLTNTFDYGSLTIDKVFGEQKDNGTADRPLATFTITSKDKTRTFVTKTDKNGKFVQADDGSYKDTDGNKFWLIPGKYTIKETAVDKGTDGCTFATDKTAFEFEIGQNGSTASVSNDDTGKFVNTPVRGAITVLKFDEKYVYKDGTLKERKTDKEMLADAEFNLCLDKAGKKVVTKLVTTDKTGVYGLPQTAVSNTETTNELGITYLANGKLLCGTYWIVETTNPEGYYTKESQSPKQVVVATAEGTETVTDIPVDVANTMIEQPFKITKTHEVPNLTAYDAAGAKIAEDGTMAAANNSNHQFEFTIERKTTSKPAFAYKVTKTTDANGVADFGDIPYGEYTVTETASAPYLTPEIKDITVDKEGVHQNGKVLTNGNTKVENILKRGSMEGKKLGYSTQEDNTVPVKDAVMGLFAGDTCLATTTTDAAGHYSFSDIPYGNYYVKEVKAPAYYNISESTREVNITADGQNIDTTGNPIVDAPAIMDLHLHKVQNEFDHKVMKDVTFKLKGDDFLTNSVTREVKTDADGNLVMTKLPVGEYTLTEVKVDDFEEPDTFKVKITNKVVGSSNEGTMTVTKISGGEATEVTAENGVYTIENTRIRRDFSFTKLGTDDEADLTKASPLAGAEFKIYDNEDCEGDEFTDNKCVGVATGDENGKVTFTDLPCGTWYVKESKAPTNFDLDETVYKVEVTQDGEVVSELENSVNEAVRGSFSFTVVPVQKPEEVLPGVSYTLSKLNPETGEYEPLFEATSDKDGKVTFDNLLIGPEYKVTETAATAGYQVAKDDITFHMELQPGTEEDPTQTAVPVIESDGNLTMLQDGSLVWQQAPTIVTFEKFDANNKALEGAQLAVIDKDGKTVDSWTSDGKPHEIVGVLTAGEAYTLRELTPPAGYQTADDVEFTVEALPVNPNDLYTQAVTMNDPQTKVFLKKTDESGKALKGATFKLEGKDRNETLSMAKVSEYLLEGKLVEGETYRLTETKAPSGYDAMKDAIEFKVEKNNVIKLVKADKNLVSLDSTDGKDGRKVFTINVKNKLTPSEESSKTKTGDPSDLTALFLLMIGAGIAGEEVVRRRKRSE